MGSILIKEERNGKNIERKEQDKAIYQLF